MSRRRLLLPVACVPLALAAAHVHGDAESFRAPPAPVTAEQDAQDDGPAFRAGTIEYSHGDPSSEEQLFMELMNRARMDPAAEAARVFEDYGSNDVKAAVNFFLALPGDEYTRAENRAAFLSYPARPPLAFNAKLIAAARTHTGKMKDAVLQSHQLPGEPALGQRVTNEAYTWQQLGESVYASAKSMLFAHAAFAIDWGQGNNPDTGRPSIGHRTALMNQTGAVFVEAGVGVLADGDPKTDVGPKLITIDFAVPPGMTRFVTGVCYVDADGDGFYDQGEGVQGVRVESPVTQSFTITSSSGGYALPVPSNSGPTTVTAIGQPGTPGEMFGTHDYPVAIGGDNVKLDLTQMGDPPPPPFALFTSVANAVIADGTTDFPLVVGAIDAVSTTLSDVDVDVNLVHGEAEGLRLTLISPAGTPVVLFDGGLAQGGLKGTFDTTLASEQDLSALAGTAYQGTWKLRVDDNDPGTTGTLVGWGLRIRPAWLRPLAWNDSNLQLTKFAVKNVEAAGADSITFAATVDVGGATGDLMKNVLLRLRAADSGTELYRVNVTDAAPNLKLTKSATSKVTVKAKIAGVDLPALPGSVTVELAVGDAIVRETIPIAGGAPKALSDCFVVDSVASTSSGGTRTTTVKGRVLAPFDADGGVELLLGDTVANLAAEAVSTKGTKRTGKGTGALRKFTLDTKTGAFLVKVISTHEAVVDGVCPVGLRLGATYFDDVVKPSVSGSTATY